MTKNVKWTPNKLIEEVEQIVKQELKRESERAVEEIRASFTRGISEPGQPPGIKTGTLYRGVQARVQGRRLIIGVSPSVPYAMALEMGMPSKGLQPRPYLRPQRMRSRVRLTKILIKRLS